MSNNIHSILWYQTPNASEEDVIVYNGKIVSGIDDATGYFHQLDTIAQKRNKKTRPWSGIVGKYFFCKGYLDSVDEKQRPLIFMFVTTAKDYSSKLTEALSVIGYNMSEQTKNCITSFPIQTKRSVMCFGIAICAFILLAILYLLIK